MGSTQTGPGGTEGASFLSSGGDSFEGVGFSSSGESDFTQAQPLESNTTLTQAAAPKPEKSDEPSTFNILVWIGLHSLVKIDLSLSFSQAVLHVIAQCISTQTLLSTETHAHPNQTKQQFALYDLKLI